MADNKKFDVELDALIVGAGFSGLFMLHNLRREGMRVRLYEAGSGIGGTWYWNSYPGARVDSDFCVYQFHDPEIYKGFEFTERFPGRDEIMRYFAHVDSTLSLSKDICFNTRVTTATFDSGTNGWIVGDKSTRTTWARHLILCTGFVCKKYTPDFKGLQTFAGDVFHSARWPKNRKIEFTGKKVSVIGTGCSGVQVIQEVGPVALALTVYQRTPNTAIPMRQCPLPSPNQPTHKDFPAIFDKTRNCMFGSQFVPNPIGAFEASPLERQQHYEKTWENGGMCFCVETYKNVWLDDQANDTAYDFWAQKTRERIHDLKKKDILAPLVKPHSIFAKRPSLEQSYYDVLNQENVQIIDVNKSPILEVTQNGIRTEKEGIVEADVLVLATGFDEVTGGILKIDIRNGHLETLKSKWSQKLSTYLGISTSGFPNMFFLYGPQGPTSLATGVTTLQIQGSWLSELLVKMRNEGKEKVVPEEDAEANYTKLVNDIWDATLFSRAEGSYNGANIPGKNKEPLSFAGGVPMYRKMLDDCRESDYNGFSIE